MSSHGLKHFQTITVVSSFLHTFVDCPILKWPAMRSARVSTSCGSKSPRSRQLRCLPDEKNLRSVHMVCLFGTRLGANQHNHLCTYTKQHAQLWCFFYCLHICKYMFLFVYLHVHMHIDRCVIIATLNVNVYIDVVAIILWALWAPKCSKCCLLCLLSMWIFCLDILNYLVHPK